MNNNDMGNDLNPTFVRQRIAEMDERVALLQEAIDSGDLDSRHLALAMRFQTLLKEGSRKWLALAIEANKIKILFDAGEISELERCKMQFGAFMEASEGLADLCERKEALLGDLMALEEEEDPADWWKHGKKA